MGASFLPLMMFTLLWGGVGIVLPFLVPKGATQGLPDSNALAELESQQPSDSSLLSFHPKYFDFNESPVGVPRLGVVRVDNRLKNENLKLISISGNTVHFHSSFFADKVIGPESNTTFEIVFLSRVEGLVESNLYIHTSKGLFKYYVKGFGLPNPYRLKPLVGARIPVNGTYEPLITMHNTHDTKIQVVEMHSSGAEFHLQLPDGVEPNAAGSAWAIEPFETKSVMKGSFQGKADGNHTGFIKIRVNSTSESSEYLLLPVEVQVSSEPGMYSPQDSLDFGLLVQSDKPKTLSLFIINAEQQPVNVQAVSVKGAPNPAVKIEFRPLVIEPDNSVSTVVALVTFDPSQASDSKYSHGMIQIVSECGKSVTVPFRATVMQGELEYNASSLGFFVKSDLIPPRNFSVRNKFSATVAIYNVAVSHPDVVKLSFNQTFVIAPGEEQTIFSMKIHKKEEICDARNKIEVTVKSNITDIKLPLMCYDGKLEMHTFDNGEIDCGRLELYSTHTEYFSLENKNPVEIRLKSWGSNSSLAKIDLVGMQKGVKEDLNKIQDFDALQKSLFLQPGHMAVFSIEIRRPATEGTFFGETYVTTDHNQTLHVPFRFAVSKGSVFADTFVFDKVFPGKISCEKLYLGSSYNRTLLLSSIRSRPPKLLWFSPSPGESPEIPPMRRSYVGKVHFDPRTFCDLDCYAGFTLKSPTGKSWMKAARLGWDGGDLDWDIMRTLQKRFESLGEATVSNISVWVDTNEVGGYKLPTKVNYIWPRILSQKPIVFPLTALGNESIIEIPVNNPSSFPMLVQAVLASEYGPHWSRFLVPSANNNVNNFPGGNFTAGEQAFNISGVFTSSSQQNNSIEMRDIQLQLFRAVLTREGIDDSLHLPGLAFVVPAGLKYFLRTTYRPSSKDLASTVILLRNNLTGIEVITAKGRAGLGQLTVGNGAPGSTLLFQLTEKLLQACQAEAATSKYVPPQLTVRRSFLARNIGEMPLHIHIVEVFTPESTLFGLPWHLSLLGFGMMNSYFGSTSSPNPAGEYCEGYGFRILNCHSFTLQPNHTHSIDIAFSPDFTMSKVVRTLRLVDSSGTEYNYTLVAMIPSKMLSICSSIISRPAWEYVLKIFLVIGVGVAIIAAALMSYVEAGSVVSSTPVQTVRVVSGEACIKDGKEGGAKFDLKAVADQVGNRFKRNNNKENNKSSSSTQTATGYSSANHHNSQLPNGTATKSIQHFSNGTANSVLSNNNSSTLRNRRTKKGGVENSNATSPTSLVPSTSSTTMKLADKSNQKSSSPPHFEEITSALSTGGGGFCKKNKENSPTSADTGNAISLNSKKKKGMPVSSNSSSNVQNSTTPSSSSNKQKKRRNSGGNGGSFPNVSSLVSLSAKGASKAEQEETSSTTTESSNCSNADDFYIPSSNQKPCKESQAKNNARASSSLSQENINSAVAGQQQLKGNGKGKQQETGKKKQGQECKQDLSFMDDNASIQTKGSSPTSFNDENAMVMSSGKKKNSKRKEQLQNSGSFNNTDSLKGVDGKISPSMKCRHTFNCHNDMAMWDAPIQCGPCGDSLSELAAQTEAFVMHRPMNIHKRSGSSEHLILGGSNPDGGRHVTSRNSHSPQFSQVLMSSGSYQHQMQHQQQLLQIGSAAAVAAAGNVRHRRPTAGIIGQSRYGSGLSPTSPTYYSQLQAQSSNRHTPPSRTLSNPNNNALGMNNNAWSTDILPHNGCDIWRRKSSTDAVGSGALTQTFSSVAGSSASTLNNDIYATGNMLQTNYASILDGFPTSSSPGLSNRSSDDGGYFSLGSGNGSGGGGIMTSSAVTGGVSSSYVSGSGNGDNSAGGGSQLYNYGMDIFNTLSLTSNSFEASMQYRQPHQTSALQQESGSTHSTSRATHNYLQRMRSEPASARGDQNRAFPSASAWNNQMNYYDVDAVGGASSRLLARSSNSPSGLEGGKLENVGSGSGGSSSEMPWSLGTSSAGSKENISQDRGLYADWPTALAASSMQAGGGRRSVGNGIWEPNGTGLGNTQDSGTSKWPTSFANSVGGSVDSSATVAVSGGSRGATLGNLDHHREVERGLGFNPFTTNIWEQTESSPVDANASWSTSSTPGYRYDNRE